VRSCNHCCQAKLHIHYIFCTSAALVIQCAKHMGHIMMSSVACPARLTQKWHTFMKKLLNIECLIFSTTCVCNTAYLIPIKVQQDITTTVLHVKLPLFLSDFNHTWILSMDIQKILKYKISRQSVRWKPSCSMPRDGHEEANSCFPQMTMNKKRFYLAQIWRHQAPLKTVWKWPSSSTPFYLHGISQEMFHGSKTTQF
jgi:hypothetical protein